MPPGEIAALSQAPVSAALGQPDEAADLFGIDRHTIRHLGLTIGIVRAAAGRLVEHAACELGEVYLAGLLVLELDEAAAATAVAQDSHSDRVISSSVLALQKGRVATSTTLVLAFDRPEVVNSHNPVAGRFP